ncbi:MAG: FeoB-associated Cys-rich membrane protein [Clostridia bacterium]|nr:FeoB-associated Cys-rich membrane protein [Clostridia bacterium]
MEDYIIIAIVSAIVIGICVYLYKAKKRGETCIGCPYAKQCGGKCSGGCDHTESEN